MVAFQLQQLNDFVSATLFQSHYLVCVYSFSIAGYKKPQYFLKHLAPRCSLCFTGHSPPHNGDMLLGVRESRLSFCFVVEATELTHLKKKRSCRYTTQIQCSQIMPPAFIDQCRGHLGIRRCGWMGDRGIVGRKRG